MRKPNPDDRKEYCDHCGRVLFRHGLEKKTREFLYNVTPGMLIHNPRNETFFCSTHCIEKFEPQRVH